MIFYFSGADIFSNFWLSRQNLTQPCLHQNIETGSSSRNPPRLGLLLLTSMMSSTSFLVFLSVIRCELAYLRASWQVDVIRTQIAVVDSTVVSCKRELMHQHTIKMLLSAGWNSRDLIQSLIGSLRFTPTGKTKPTTNQPILRCASLCTMF